MVNKILELYSRCGKAFWNMVFMMQYYQYQ